MTSAGVAIVGCGLIGQKRAKALGEARLVACADIELERAQTLARAHNAASSTDWKEVIQHPDVDIVIVATTNNMLAEITQTSIQVGKHVLVEKPAARSAAVSFSIIARLRQWIVGVHYRRSRRRSR